MSGGEFDWGGRLRKGIGGAQRFPQNGWKPFAECKGRTGAVASERVSEAPKGSLRMVGNHPKSAKAEGSLTVTPTGGAGTKVGLSDPVV